MIETRSRKHRIGKDVAADRYYQLTSDRANEAQHLQAIG